MQGEGITKQVVKNCFVDAIQHHNSWASCSTVWQLCVLKYTNTSVLQELRDLIRPTKYKKFFWWTIPTQSFLTTFVSPTLILHQPWQSVTDFLFPFPHSSCSLSSPFFLPLPLLPLTLPLSILVLSLQVDYYLYFRNLCDAHTWSIVDKKDHCEIKITKQVQL